MDGVGERLKQLRKQHKYTQNDISEFLEISQSLYAKIETGERNLKMTQLIQLCDLYIVPEEYILYGEGEIPKQRLFYKNNKGINLKTIMKMNRIVLNLQEMSEIAEREGIK